MIGATSGVWMPWGVRRWLSRPWRQVGLAILRICVIMLWTVWAALAWWSAPRPVHTDQARGDIAAGRVSSFVRADAWDRSRRFWGTPPSPHLAPEGMLLVWTTTSGQIRYTAPDLPFRPADLVGAGGSGSAAHTEELAAQLHVAAERGNPMTIDYRSVASAAKGTATVLALLCLAVVIAGPPPERGTRVFWFWIAMVPLGFGILVWLATERPWSLRAREQSRQRAIDSFESVPRRRGLTGFAMLLLASLVIGGLTVAFRAVFGPSVVPG